MERKQLKQNIFYQYGFQIAKYLIPFVTLPYLTRVLGPDAYGVRVYIMAAMTFVQAAIDFGFMQYGTKVVALFDDMGMKNSRLDKIFAEITFAKVLLAILAAIVLLIISFRIELLRENILYVVIAFSATFLTALLPDFIFMGFNTMKILTTRYVLSKLIPTVLVFLLIQSSSDLLWVPALDFLAAATAVVVTMRQLKRKYRLKLYLPSFKGTIDCIKASAPYFIGNVACIVFNSFTIMIVGAYGQSSDVAYWGLSLNALSVMQALYSPITNALYPHMLRNRDWRLFFRLSCLSTAALCVAAVLLYLLSGFVVFLLAGDGYSEAIPVMQSISPLVVLSFISILLGLPLMGAVGLIKSMTQTAVISALIYIVILCLYVSLFSFDLLVVCTLRVAIEGLFILFRLASCLLNRESIKNYFRATE